MSRFSKQDLYAEIVKILLVQARQLTVCTGNFSASEAFLGVSLNDDEAEETKINHDRLDLDRFHVVRSISACYDYAFYPSGDDAYDGDFHDEVADFLAGMPREDFSGSIDDYPSPGAPAGSLIADTYWAAAARYALDQDNGETLDIRQLALLADMTEGAVRNALSQKGDAGLQAIPKSKPVAIALDEARRWLSGRRGFTPTPSRPSEDPMMNERLRQLDRIEYFADFMTRHVRRAFGSKEAAAQTLGWELGEIEAWCDGSFVFDGSHAASLAKAIDADVPTLVGKAHELSLRRDLTLAG